METAGGNFESTRLPRDDETLGNKHEKHVAMGAYLDIVKQFRKPGIERVKATRDAVGLNHSKMIDASRADVGGWKKKRSGRSGHLKRYLYP